MSTELVYTLIIQKHKSLRDSKKRQNINYINTQKLLMFHQQSASLSRMKELKVKLGGMKNEWFIQRDGQPVKMSINQFLCAEGDTEEETQQL